MEARAEPLPQAGIARDEQKAQARRSGFAWAMGVAVLRMASVVVGLTYVKYYTNALSVEQVGTFFYLGTLSYLLNALVFVPVDSYMQSRLSALPVLPAPAVSKLVASTLVVGAVACSMLGTPLVTAGHLRPADLPLLYGLAALLYLCSSIRNLLNIRGQATFAASMVLLEATGRLAAFAIISHLFAPSAQSLLGSSIAALAAELALLLWQARRSLPLNDDRHPLDSARRIASTAAVLAAGAVANTAQLQNYRVLFPAAGHPLTAAALGVTSNIGGVAMSACAQVYAQLFLPRLYQTRGASIGAYVGWGGVLSAAVLAVAWLFAEPLVLHLTKPAYLPYAAAVAVGVVVEAGNLVIGAYGVFLTLQNRVGVLFRFQFAGAVLSLGGCLTLLTQSPQSPLLVGAVVAASQLLIAPALGIYIHRLKRKSS